MSTIHRTVLPLSAVNRDSPALAGGKGANLGELIAAGVPVPPGFVITTDAYRDCATGEALSTAILAGDHPTVRRVITELDIPTALRDRIVDAYRELGSPPVAVRSSGTAEDLPSAAFAGQHDTFLNVVGETALLEAVRRCWASLWTDRVVEYRRDKDIDPTDIAIAVVVQRMVDARAAGVMFTADPVTGHTGHAVVDASPGLGEAVVSGLVTPDHYVVDKRRGRIVTFTPGRREVVIRSLPGGGTEESAGSATDRPTLDRRTLRRLVALGDRVAEHFGAPQDTEWCLADDGLHIVQARPVTAMPAPVEPASAVQRQFLATLSELIPTRPYPLDLSAWLAPNLVGVAAFMAAMGPRLPAAGDFLVTEDGVMTRIRPPRIGVGPGTPITLLRNARRNLRYSRDTLDRDPRLVSVHEAVADSRRVDLSTLTLAELADRLDAATELYPRIMRMRADYIARAALGMVPLVVTMALTGGVTDLGLLIGGVETRTAETNRELARLAGLIRAEPALATVFAEQEASALAAALRGSATGRDFLTEFDAFLDRYGHRESVMLLLSEPSWIDAPHIVLGILKGMAAAPATDRHGASGQAERRLFSRLLLRRGPLRAMASRQLERARAFTQFREDTHFYATMAQPVVRRIVMAFADRLVAAGALDDRDEVFHLDRSELTGLRDRPLDGTTVGELRAAVARRRARREELADTPLIDPRHFAAAPVPDGVLVRGTPGSGGVVTGPVRVIKEPAEFERLRPGEVLVAPFTNPAWTPLFQHAAAAVVDTGAAMSHAAIIARECGIPAVMGATAATAVLKDGQLVTVDGDRGLVSPADRD